MARLHTSRSLRFLARTMCIATLLAVTLPTWAAEPPTSTGARPAVEMDIPYADGGDPATLTTGAPCQWVGFLLRSWLIVQKLGQLHAVAQGDPSGAPGAAPASAHSAPWSQASGGHACGLGTGMAAAALALAGWRTRPRRGVASPAQR